METRNKLSEIEQITARARFREETEHLRQDNERKRQLADPMHERLFNSLIVVSYGILGYYAIKHGAGIVNHIANYLSNR